MNELIPGLTNEIETVVTEADTAEHLGSGSVPVFGTPALVGLMENAAVRALEGRLPPGQTSVGGRIDVRHLAATPVPRRIGESGGSPVGIPHRGVGRGGTDRGSDSRAFCR